MPAIERRIEAEGCSFLLVMPLGIEGSFGYAVSSTGGKTVVDAFTIRNTKYFAAPIGTPIFAAC